MNQRDDGICSKPSWAWCPEPMARGDRERLACQDACCVVHIVIANPFLEELMMNPAHRAAHFALSASGPLHMLFILPESPAASIHPQIL